jgi:hypothetical protein
MWMTTLWLGQFVRGHTLRALIIDIDLKITINNGGREFALWLVHLLELCSDIL